MINEADIVEDKQFRLVPEDGHALLLMEANPTERTFSDYPNLVTCLDNISELYEQSRLVAGQKKDDYDIHQLWNWIDEFHRMELFIYDKGIARYKRATRTELKQLFIEQIKKLGKPEDGEQNGTIDNDDDETEDWD